jgi:hypothetical protein
VSTDEVGRFNLNTCRGAIDADGRQRAEAV